MDLWINEGINEELLNYQEEKKNYSSFRGIQRGRLGWASRFLRFRGLAQYPMSERAQILVLFGWSYQGSLAVPDLLYRF